VFSLISFMKERTMPQIRFQKLKEPHILYFMGLMKDDATRNLTLT